MRNIPLSLLLLLLLFTNCTAQNAKRELYGVGFYNLENLFDTIHDDSKNDYEFLPEGKYKWGTLKYTNKVRNIATVLNDLGTDVLPMGMAVVGVCEVENSRVLKDVVRHEILAPRGWKFIHIEGEDKRGIDCALLYNPELFRPSNSRLVPYTSEDGGTAYKTRGFLVVTGIIAGETVHFIVNHWPSRYAKPMVRERAGVIVRQLKDSLLAAMPESKVIVMGDMNDDPDDKSINEYLGAVCKKEEVRTPGTLYTPWLTLLREKNSGTSVFEEKWNLFDQIMLSGNLVGNNSNTLQLYRNEIFSREYLFEQKGRYKGCIKRTHTGGVWLNGYSDHLPVIVYLAKSKK